MKQETAHDQNHNRQKEAFLVRRTMEQTSQSVLLRLIVANHGIIITTALTFIFAIFITDIFDYQIASLVINLHRIERPRAFIQVSGRR